MFRRAVHWPGVASVTNPLAVTQAYAARFAALGGVVLTGDARSLHRAGGLAGRHRGRPARRDAVVLALGPWAPDVLEPLGIRLPLGIKRGYHRHFRPRGNAGADAAGGRRRERLLPGADGAGHPAHHRRRIRRRDAPPTPVQFDRLMPAARALFPLGEPVEATPWMGSRPCFAGFTAGDRPRARPAACGSPTGHAHWGLTLGPATGRLIAEMMTGATPFCDPAPYGAERFTR